MLCFGRTRNVCRQAILPKSTARACVAVVLVHRYIFPLTRTFSVVWLQSISRRREKKSAAGTCAAVLRVRGGGLEEDWVWKGRTDDGRGVNGDRLSGGGEEG